MQQPTASSPSPNASSFAGILAALASPAPKTAPAWNEDDLEEDIATLSYERALRTHARYRSAGLVDQSLTGPAWESSRIEEPAHSGLASAEPAATDCNANNASIGNPELSDNLDTEMNRPQAAHSERNLKDASITIRMSKAECAQLHRRADEAGVTVSAYLRSCTFEAESLRAMVKETMTQLRVATAQKQPRRSWFHALAKWLARVLTPWHGSQRIVRA